MIPIYTIKPKIIIQNFKKIKTIFYTKYNKITNKIVRHAQTLNISYPILCDKLNKIAIQI